MLAGGAFAYTPRLTVATSGGPAAATPVTITLARPAGDPATARVRISTPAAYATAIPAAPGVVLGTATAAGVSGEIVVDDPARHAADECAPGPHDAVWTVEPLGLAIYVDATPLTLELCPPPDSQPATLTLAFAKGVWSNPAGRGEFVWSALFTPVGEAGRDPSAEVESRALFRQPALLSLAGRLGTRGRIVLFGRLTAGGKKLGHAAVKLLAGRSARTTRSISSTKTTAAGRYAFSLRLRRTTFFRTRVDLPAQDVTKTGCAAPSDAPGGCVTATLAPLHALSSTFLKVTVRG